MNGSTREHAEKELERLEAQRSSSHTLEDMRESLEEICKRVRGCIASMDYEEKRLGLEALNLSATLTDDHVEVNAVLGVVAQDSRLTTTGRTSGCFSAGAYNYRAIYVMNPVAVKVLVA